MILLAFTGYKLFYLANRFNPNVNKITLIRSADDEVAFKPQEGGFDFAFGMKKPLDPSYGYFTVNYIN